jgi:hypothetical protein
MCDPVTVGIVGLGVAGTVMSAQGARRDADAKRDYYNYIASANDQQAVAVEQNAQLQNSLIQDQAGRQKLKIREDGDQLQGAQRATMAANGVSGATAEDVIRDSLSRQQKDELAIQYSADLKDWANTREAKLKAWDLRTQAVMGRKSAYNAEVAGNYAVATSLLSGATQTFKAGAGAQG